LLDTKHGALAGNLRKALAASATAVPNRDILTDARVDDETPVLAGPSEEGIVADYALMRLMLGRHPLSAAAGGAAGTSPRAIGDADDRPNWPARSQLWTGHRTSAPREHEPAG
jgi:hypothetical protein